MYTWQTHSWYKTVNTCLIYVAACLISCTYITYTINKLTSEKSLENIQATVSRYITLKENCSRSHENCNGVGYKIDV